MIGKIMVVLRKFNACVLKNISGMRSCVVARVPCKGLCSLPFEKYLRHEELYGSPCSL